MPKMKTNSAAKRRFHVTGTGKVMRMKGAKRHKKLAKSRRVLQLDEHKFPVAKAYRRIMSRVLPYGA